MPGFAPTTVPIQISDFRAGLNTRDAPYLLTDGQARDVSNVQATEAGAITKRTGLVPFANPAGGISADPLTSLFALESVSPTVLVAADSAKLYKISTVGAITSLKTGLTANRWEFVSAPVVSGQGPLFAMNGTDTPQQWDGAAAGTSSWTNASGSVAVPNGKYMAYFQNQVFVSGVAANPSRVYWSAIADATNWDPASNLGAGFMDFDPNDGGAITGIGVIGPYILVGKPRKLWVITSVAAATSRMISNTVGIAAHRSLAQSPQGTFFLSEDRGVYVTNGSTVTALNDSIAPTFQSIAPGLRTQAAGAVFNGHYYLSVSLSGTANDTTLDFDTLLGSWWKHTISANQFVVWHPGGASSAAQLYNADSINHGLVFHGSVTNGPPVNQCFVSGTYTDYGSPMTWVWRGPWQSPVFYRHKFYNTPYYRKRLRQVRMDGFGTVNFSLAKDFAGAETLIAQNVFNYAASSDTFAGAGIYGAADGSTFGGVAGVTPYQTYALGVARAFSLVVGSTSTTADAILSYILLVTPLRDLVVSS